MGIFSYYDKGTIISDTKLNEINPNLARWLKKVYGVEWINFTFYLLPPQYENGSDCVKFSIFTDTHRYEIGSSRPNFTDTKGTLECVAYERKNRIGEPYPRSYDLVYGKYSKETFDAIIHNILVWETINLRR